ncbi:SA1362 family protein [Virgibacillus soli]|uniref:SA1362 family protein n=1 Tax=Paracerasibacillus soli TaxID=480284 RepID=UPI0035E99934
MLRNFITKMFYVVIVLAIIGLGISLFTNTLKFLTSIFLSIVFAAILFGILYFVFTRNRTGSASNQEMKKYRQAVKQSKKRYQSNEKASHTRTQHPQAVSTQKKLRKRPSHLSVIEGNKSKRKNRA